MFLLRVEQWCLQLELFYGNIFLSEVIKRQNIMRSSASSQLCNLDIFVVRPRCRLPQQWLLHEAGQGRWGEVHLVPVRKPHQVQLAALRRPYWHTGIKWTWLSFWCYARWCHLHVGQYWYVLQKKGVKNALCVLESKLCQLWLDVNWCRLSPHGGRALLHFPGIIGYPMEQTLKYLWLTQWKEPVIRLTEDRLSVV